MVQRECCYGPWRFGCGSKHSVVDWQMAGVMFAWYLEKFNTHYNPPPGIHLEKEFYCGYILRLCDSMYKVCFISRIQVPTVFQTTTATTLYCNPVSPSSLVAWIPRLVYWALISFFLLFILLTYYFRRLYQQLHCKKYSNHNAFSFFAFFLYVSWSS